MNNYDEIKEAVSKINIHGDIPKEEINKQYYYMAKCKEWVLSKEKEIGRKLTACVNTFGCQMNARDSEKLIGILKIIGYEETENEKADFVLYNTCTVREMQI